MDIIDIINNICKFVSINDIYNISLINNKYLQSFHNMKYIWFKNVNTNILQFFLKQPENLLNVATYIKSLHISYVENLNDNIVKQFTNLKILLIDKQYSSLITSKCIKMLTSLTKLEVCGDKYFNAFKKLTNLKFLKIHRGFKIKDKYISRLSNLIQLSCKNTQITCNGIKYCTKLQHLEMNGYISDEGIIPLTNLKSLLINFCITDNVITKLTNLTYLNVKFADIDDNSSYYVKRPILNNNNITLVSLQQLPQLVNITIDWTQVSLITLPHLKYINIVFSECPFASQLEILESLRKAGLIVVKTCKDSSTVYYQKY